MNRFYPGKIDGTQTERASLAMTREVVENATTSSTYTAAISTRACGRIRLDEDRQREAGRDFAGHAAGVRTATPSSFPRTDRRIPAASRYLENTASTRGKPSITAEAGHAGTVESRDVDALVERLVCRSCGT